MATLNDMTVSELLYSAKNEVDGLETHLRGRGYVKSDDDPVDFLQAYTDSILARITVAEMKLG